MKSKMHWSVRQLAQSTNTIRLFHEHPEMYTRGTSTEMAEVRESMMHAPTCHYGIALRVIPSNNLVGMNFDCSCLEDDQDSDR